MQIKKLCYLSTFSGNLICLQVSNYAVGMSILKSFVLWKVSKKKQ